MEYDDLIERERRRRTLLVQKLDETDRRIQALLAMSRQHDPLDKWLDEQTETSTSAPAPAVVAPAAGAVDVVRPATRKTRDTPKKITAHWLDLIEHLGFDGKDFVQVQTFMARSGMPMLPGSIRPGLMNYRKDYGMVANPKPGFYCATQKGIDFVQQRRNRVVSE